jgi:hypothetical protein
MARIYTHSHATVVRTTSINEANKPAIVSLPPVPLDTEEVLRVPMRERERERERERDECSQIMIHHIP